MPEEDADEMPEECESCGFEGAELTKYPPRPMGDGEPNWFCEICAATYAGNAHQYPRQYPEQGAILKSLAWCTNRILQELRSKN